MKDLFGWFRFGDFSVFFLPGLVMLGAVAAAMSLAGLVNITAAVHGIGIAEAVAIGCAAYCCGAVISGSSYPLVPALYAATRFRRYVDPRSAVYPRELAEAVEAALAELLGRRLLQPWSADHFYLARTAVQERMPQTTAEAMRQNDLMRLRENLVIPLLTWSGLGIAYSAFYYRQSHVAAVALAAATVVVTYFVAGRIACRSVENRTREVREICDGFLIGYRLGLFKPAG